MNAKELVSYLNGAIELGEVFKLDSFATEKLVKKLKEVNVDSSIESGFCTWLKGFLDANEQSEINDKQFSKIATKLYELNDQKHAQYGKIEFPATSSEDNGSILLRC